MSRHFRRFCFYLAGKLKMSVRQLLNEMDSYEISEWMAYELTLDEKWRKKYQHDIELEESRKMSPEEQAQAFMKMLKGSR